jgi:hypothetical protein
MPSAERLEALESVVKDFRRQGVVFYLVDVGERRDEVEKLVKAQKIDLPAALDPQGKSTDEFLINSIPAAVLIGKSGTVQAVLQGPEVGAEAAGLLTRDLQRLLKGEALAPGK